MQGLCTLGESIKSGLQSVGIGIGVGVGLGLLSVGVGIALTRTVSKCKSLCFRQDCDRNVNNVMQLEALPLLVAHAIYIIRTLNHTIKLIAF